MQTVPGSTTLLRQVQDTGGEGTQGMSRMWQAPGVAEIIERSLRCIFSKCVTTSYSVMIKGYPKKDDFIALNELSDKILEKHSLI